LKLKIVDEQYEEVLKAWADISGSPTAKFLQDIPRGRGSGLKPFVTKQHGGSVASRATGIEKRARIMFVREGAQGNIFGHRCTGRNPFVTSSSTKHAGGRRARGWVRGRASHGSAGVEVV